MRLHFILIGSIIFYKSVWGQNIQIAGYVYDSLMQTPLPGVYVKVIGTNFGAITNEKGYFSFQIPSPTLPIRLEVSYLGYVTKILEISMPISNLKIYLQEKPIIAPEIVVSASRIPESYLESPVTIEKVDLLTIRETPTLNPFDALVYLKGVDVATGSLTFRSYNTRGFNSIGNSRFLIRIDGVDIQAPGLNFPIGLLMSPSEIEIQSMELVPGANSALYGPNAFNGLLNVNTKNPFDFPGLSASLKIGANHWDQIDTTIQPYFDFVFRYAYPLSSRFGIKIGGKWLQATDWMATDYRDIAVYQGTKNLSIAPPGPTNPGYDGQNIYGDEIASKFYSSNTEIIPGFPLVPEGDTILLARTGYTEHALFNYQNQVIKFNTGLYYRLSDQTQLEYLGYLTSGTTIYQGGNRFVLDQFLYHNHKIEISSDHYFLRGYASFENSGNSYDTRLTAMGINRAWKPDTAWFAQYLLAFYPTTNMFLNYLLTLQGRDSVPPNDPVAARQFADSDNRFLNTPDLHQLLQFLGLDSLEAVQIANQITAGKGRVLPGTPEFQHLLDSITSKPISQGGSKFLDQTRFYHIEAQYDFSPHWDWLEIIAGGSYRYYDLRSSGTIFPDTNEKFFVYEYGAYLQATKRLWNEHLRLSSSIRLDKSKNFMLQYSPRIASVLTFGKQRQHNIRLSYQTAFRNPTMQGQYLDLNIQVYHFLGGLRMFDEKYGLILYDTEGNIIQNNYTAFSGLRFLETGDSTILVRGNIEPLKPEQVQMWELGYKALLQQKLLIDAVVYFGRYRNFIGILPLLGPVKEDVGTDSVYLTVDDLKRGRFQIYGRYMNARSFVDAYGGTIGLQYAFSPKWTIAINYTYAQMLPPSNPEDEDFILGFNTPPHKVNLTLTGRKLLKHFSISLNSRWQDQFEYNDSFGRGIVPSFWTSDFQFSYLLPKYPIQLRIGGTNIFNYRHIEAVGGPTIGSLYYFQISFDPTLHPHSTPSLQPIP